MEISDIRALIESYLGGADYSSFRGLLMGIYVALPDSEDSEALMLCRAAEWELADFSEGLIDERQLKENLSALLLHQRSNTVIRALTFGITGDMQPQVITGTSSITESI